MEDAKFRAPEHDRGVFCGHGPQRDAFFGDDLLENVISGKVRIKTADPYFSDRKFSEQEKKPVHVIRMGMGQDDEVQPADTAVPQKRGRNAPADVEAIVRVPPPSMRTVFPEANSMSAQSP